jgi:hypothetical protein
VRYLNEIICAIDCLDAVSDWLSLGALQATVDLKF